MTSRVQYTEVNKKKRECNAKAQKIILNLIDGTDNEVYFLQQLHWINQNHYDDIIEERAIMKVCGYPLCKQKLENIPKKNYHISSTKNKVYDITNRKKFCSNQCYKASCFLKQQLFTSPLWIRDEENKVNFTLLKNSSELFGDEVNFNIEKVKIPEKINAHSNRLLHAASVENKCENINNSSCKIFDKQNEQEKYNCEPFDDEVSFNTEEVKFSEKIDACSNKSLSTTNMENNSENPNNSSSEIFVKQNEHEKCNLSLLPQSNFIKKTKNSEVCFNNVQSPSRTEESLPKDKLFKNSQKGILKITETSNNIENNICRTSECNLNLKNIKIEVNHIEKTSENLSRKNESFEKELHDGDYFSKNGTYFVKRVEKSLREWLTIDSLVYIMSFETVKQLLEKSKVFDKNHFNLSNKFDNEKYSSVGKCLNIQKTEKDNLKKIDTAYDVPLKPVPNYDTLKEQTKEMVIKVRSFYQGDKKVMFDENAFSNEEIEEGTEKILPPLYLHAKNAIRRNAVLSKLKIFLPNIVSILNLSSVDISDKIRNLAFTCSFSSHNIIFKPLEWNLIGLILIKLLSLGDTELQIQLHEKSDYINNILISYNLEKNYPELLCSWLTNIDRVLEKK